MEEKLKKGMLGVAPLVSIHIGKENPRAANVMVDDLKASIRAHGILEPVIVRKDKDDKYVLVAGSRRIRAMQSLVDEGIFSKTVTIPVVIMDIDEKQAAEVAFVENLVRADLTPFEEAAGFKFYLELYGAESIGELSERTGAAKAYINRRVAVLSLPEDALAAWQAGKIQYGHLEQFLRVDKTDASKLLKLTLANRLTVHLLEQQISREMLVLSSAKFSKKSAGCDGCSKNTKVQADLFGEGFKADKVYCMDETCFHKHQLEHISVNWKKMRGELETNGVLIRAWGPAGEAYRKFDSRRIILTRKIPQVCLDCNAFVSLLDIDGRVSIQKACKDSDGLCFTKAYPSKANMIGGGFPTETKTPEVKRAIREDKQGAEFVEKFYADEFPLRIATVKKDEGLRLVLAAMCKAHPEAASKCPMFKLDDSKPWVRSEQVFLQVMALKEHEAVVEAISLMACLIALDPKTFTLDQRNVIARDLLEINIEKDFLMTREYLEAKHKDELCELGRSLGVLSDERAKNYAVVKAYNFKNDYAVLKKSDLVEVFLKSGVPLTGKVPPEIVAAGSVRAVK